MNCPDCNTEMIYRMFDMDGTNLEEFLVCPECELKEDPITMKGGEKL